MSDSYGIHWFRRDLRVKGNPALQWSWKEHSGRVLGVFCFDKKFLSRPDFSVNRFQFFLETLSKLEEELKSLGGDLLCLDVGPDEAFHDLFLKLKKPPATLSWNRDYEPFARARDNRMLQFFESKGILVHTERDHLLIEPDEILKELDPKSPYQVFTPFSRRWLQIFESPDVQRRLQIKNVELSFSLTWKEIFKEKSRLEEYREANRKKVSVRIPEAGSLAAEKQVQAFKKSLDAYKDRRDLPAVRGTSGFSIYFKNGSLTTTQVIRTLGLKYFQKTDTSGSATFLKELIWREFYYYILYKFPRVENEAFIEKYRDIQWENSKSHFEAWKEGVTGFPIVDAGMRQLKQTGWMHNRVRMIVASFLSKDLLIDWKWGERYFMEALLDGDLAPNNGGWQWAASTGCDPQPYFRVFNPKLQSEKFDPEGTYIRKYVPELEGLSSKEIHEPPPVKRGKYPGPIVNHAEQRDLAIGLYKNA